MAYLLKLFAIVVLYLLLFRPELIALPFSINMMLGVLGVVLYSFFGKKKRQVVNNVSPYLSVKSIILLLSPVLLVALITGIHNPDTDWYFVHYCASITLTFFATYIFALLLYRIYGNVTVDDVVKYIIIANYIYLMIAVLMFLNYDFFSFMSSLQKIDEALVDRQDEIIAKRLIAFGVSYSNAGVLQGCLAIIVSLYITFYNTQGKKQLFYLFSIFFFVIVGMMLSRTTIFGAFFAFLILIIHYGKRHRGKVLMYLGALLLLFYLSTLVFSSELKEHEDMIKWAFEMFYTYKDSGHFETTSSNSTLSMLNTFPDNLGTWIIGDGKWHDKTGMFYYMDTDVGIARIIWYFGIIGLIAMLYYYYKTIKMSFNKRVFGNSAKYFLYYLFAFVISASIKGFTDIFYVCILFYFCQNRLIISKKSI